MGSVTGDLGLETFKLGQEVRDDLPGDLLGPKVEGLSIGDLRLEILETGQ